MKRTLHLSESELITLIQKIINEQQTMGQSYEKGKQSTIGTGQKAQQAVKGAAKEVLNSAKQVLVTIGNTTITIISYGVAVIWVIGESVYKISAAVSQALLKILMATGKAVIGGATALSQKTINTLNKVGILIEKGAKFVTDKINSLKDSTVAVAKWFINTCKQLGTKAWAGILAGASKIKEIASVLGQFLATSWGSVQKEMGMAWDEVKNMAAGIKQSAQNAYSNVKQGAQAVGNKVANYAGKAAGFLQGFLSEMFKRYYGFKGTNTLSILVEGRKYNNRSIIL